jgi:fumarate hydratase class I
MDTKTRHIMLPSTPDEIRKLKAGDEVILHGTIVTGRDVAHKYMVEQKPQFLREILKGSIIYHCGPIVRKQGNEWKIVSAGPTTSSREEPYQADVIAHYGIVGIIGKGGMGEKTLKALKDYGAVYFHAIGGAGTLLGNAVKKVINVYKLEEFGVPEAFWVLEVADFPAVVTMDSQGNSLHREIFAKSELNLKKMLEEL